MVAEGGEAVSSSAVARRRSKQATSARPTHSSAIAGSCRARFVTARSAAAPSAFRPPTSACPTTAACATASTRSARRSPSGVIRDGVASFGRRPTFDNGAPLLEIFLFDFAGELYGETLQVEFVAWIRGEERFASAEALVLRMKEDAREARQVLAKEAGGRVQSMTGEGVLFSLEAEGSARFICAPFAATSARMMSTGFVPAGGAFAARDPRIIGPAFA